MLLLFLFIYLFFVCVLCLLLFFQYFKLDYPLYFHLTHTCDLFHIVFIGRSYTSALFERTPEEIRMALDVYQQELNRLMQPTSSTSSTPTTSTPSAAAVVAAAGQFLNAATSSSSSSTPAQPIALTNGFPQDLSIPKSAVGSVRSDEESSERDSKIRTPSATKLLLSSMTENGGENTKTNTETHNSNASLKTENSLVYMSHSLHNILRPSSSPSPDESNPSTTGTGAAGLSGPGANSGGVASPLQRIASITNSLMSQPTNPTLPQVTQRPMKAILPPITQQQFDTYQNLNTEDIVKKVSVRWVLIILTVALAVVVIVMTVCRRHHRHHRRSRLMFIGWYFCLVGSSAALPIDNSLKAMRERKGERENEKRARSC